MDAIAVNIPVQDPLAATVGHAIRAGDINGRVMTPDPTKWLRGRGAISAREGTP